MKTEIIISELSFKAIRSGGAGGQHVNKVSSKVVVSFDVLNSMGLSESEKDLVVSKLSNRLNSDSILQVACDESRSQFKNKELVIKRLILVIQSALMVAKIRKETKIPKSVIKKRIKDKKIQSDIKNSRRKPDF